MGRPEPCILFAQTFVHPQLDEYVDEVIFAEPIVITACEFLELNASSSSSAVTLLGATSPPSFALEVFVQCEGEARFRRLCQPFLYSHSSSNVLEVEAVVTNHLVVRGSYRSLSLIIYGNTAEDLGQFNIEFDLDSSLTNASSSTESKLEDLPPLLRQRNRSLEDLMFSPKALSSFLPVSDITVEIRQFLHLIFKILDAPNCAHLMHRVAATVASTVSSFFMQDLAASRTNLKQFTLDETRNNEEAHCSFIEATKNLLEYCKKFYETGSLWTEFLVECTFLDSEAELATSKQLVDMLFKHFQFFGDARYVAHGELLQSRNLILWLSLSLLLCSGRESCFHFVNGGAVEQLTCILSNEMHGSTAVTLMLLGIFEQATRYSAGCEGLLGWWPHEDETVPSGVSEGYSQLFKLLMEKQRHDVASLASYILHRLRLYQVASRYEYAVLSLLGEHSGARRVTSVTLNLLRNANLQLQKILKLITSSVPVEDPSAVACVMQSLILGTDGILSYKATNKLIASSSCRFLNQDIDSNLLSLLKDRGFLPLSVALFSSSKLRAEVGNAVDVFVDVTSSVESIILSLLFCRSGLVFLLHHPELSYTMIHALRGAGDMSKEECIPLRYAYVLLSRGVFCLPREVGINVEMHMRVVNAIDQLLLSPPHSEEFLWVLWELCDLSRSDCGRQALLALGHFPEAIKVLIEALHSAKELEPASLKSGTPLNLAIFHSAAEIFEIIVTDATLFAMGSWIEHATALHKALHSSSPGSNRKDAPTRLLEWIDAGVVYHKNGAAGLLRYAAVLASGGDAHITSTNILVSDSMDVENVVADASNGADVNVVENLLGKLVSERSFDGIALRDSSVAQLTTALRILALISENSDVAAALYDEGAVTVIYVILVNCRLMLERFFNNYDYLVDDGTECNSSSDLLLERNREKCLVDLIIPSLLILVELLQKLKDTKEQHRNTKLMNALLQLHRELSSKLASCAADLSSSYPDSALGLETVCHLLASALAFWPVYAWAPGLFHTLFDSVHATSLLIMGPKEACSLLFLLNDLFPEEGVWHWKNGMPLLTIFRSLAAGSLLGPQKEAQINWYLQPMHVQLLVCQLRPHLDKIAQVILHYAVSTLAVIRDMLRVFIIRTACQNAENGCVLVRPILSWIRNHLSEPSSPADTDAYKIFKLVDFLSCLLEHPLAKPLLLKEGALDILAEVLQRCVDASGKQVLDIRSSAKCGFDLFSCCLPILRSFSLICDSQLSAQLPGTYDWNSKLRTQDSLLIFHHLFQVCLVLPVGKELLACLTAFKVLASRAEGQAALLEIFRNIKSSISTETHQERVHERHGDCSSYIDVEWRKLPLLCCWISLYRSVEKGSPSMYAIEALEALCLGALRFCMVGKSFDEERITALRYFFGLLSNLSGTSGLLEENVKYIQGMPTLLRSKIIDDEYLVKSLGEENLHQVLESANSLSILLQNPTELVKVDDIISRGIPLFSPDASPSSRIHLLTNGRSENADEDCNVGELGDRFQWECPENLRNRLSLASLQGKRKMSSDGASRHGRESFPVDVQSMSLRGSGPSVVSSGPTRRDTFRQRKPNTSRPPSMHVDDYVARERNADGTSGSNVISVPRIGSSSGRPPSIHVDEFMARQRERQNPVPMVAAEVTSQGKSVPSENETDTAKSNHSRQLKVDLDDDLQGIDIVFDDEESEPDDKLAFPQPDDSLQKAASATVEQSPQRSIVEETESDVNSLAPSMVSSIDENTQNEQSSRMSASREMSMTREPSISVDKKYFELPDETNKSISAAADGAFDSAPAAFSSGFSSSPYSNAASLLVHMPGETRMPSPSFYPHNNLQRSGNLPVVASQGLHDQKFFPSQPPLPPTPPLPTISPVRSHVPDPVSAPSQFINSMTDLQPPLAPTYHVPTDFQSTFNNLSTSLASFSPMPDSRYPRTLHSSPSGTSRPLPPLPPTPPPFSATPFSGPLRPSISQISTYNETSIAVTETLQPSVAVLNDAQFGNILSSGSRLSHPPPLIMSPSIFSRASTVPFTQNGNIPALQQSDSVPSISVNVPAHQSSMPPIQPFTQLQPLQPPQLPCPPHLPQHQRPPIHVSPQAEQGGSLLHMPGQMQMQAQKMLPQSQMSQYHLYYKSQQQENLSQLQQQKQVESHQPQVQLQQRDAATQQEQDSALTLQQYFSSPQAIQSLLSDRDKLCQLLEQHPKLMQMLQEKLGQL
ncbi:hypothetical protein Nepgr_024863 [Nepenthes gracilis]|uniref:Virilizer N-terminal domain-containing protein n=1 Tax=Nepenthes gracilis TaxID=150966 RepID=A0AAD3T4T7_NEPGR|nr:hypothetical protein Nepgr_024863 [Nepenthes gracilis]